MPLTALDYEEIRQTMARYVRAVDFGDSDELAATFTEDGSFEILGILPDAPLSGVFQGREAMFRLGEILRTGLKGHCRHWVQAPIIEEIADGQVRLMSYLAVIRAGEAPNSGLILTGIYRDEMKKVGDRWRFSSRVFQADPQPEHIEPPDDVLVLRRDEFVARVMGNRVDRGNLAET